MKRFLTSSSLALVSLSFFSVSTAHAALITVESVWQSGRLNTTAVFENGGIVDLASNEFELLSFDMVFTPALGSLSAISAVLAPSDMVIIKFGAADVIDYSAGAVEFTPGVIGPNNFVINPSLDRLSLNAGFSGQFNFLLESSSVMPPVPQPASWARLLCGRANERVCRLILRIWKTSDHASTGQLRPCSSHHSRPNPESSFEAAWCSGLP